jgi:GNAT superfamily N-acetyltransferase
MAHHYDRRPVTVAEHRWVVGAGGFLGELTLAPIPEKRLRMGLPYAKGQPLLFVKDVRVHPRCRGRQWSDKLLAAATRWADRQGVDLWLYVEPFGRRPRPDSEALKRLYRRHGFRGYYTPGEQYVDEMVRRARC